MALWNKFNYSSFVASDKRIKCVYQNKRTKWKLEKKWKFPQNSTIKQQQITTAYITMSNCPSAQNKWWPYRSRAQVRGLWYGKSTPTDVYLFINHNLNVWNASYTISATCHMSPTCYHVTHYVTFQMSRYVTSCHMWHVTCVTCQLCHIMWHMSLATSHATCHIVTYVTCHIMSQSHVLSHVTCHVSHATCFVC